MIQFQKDPLCSVSYEDKIFASMLNLSKQHISKVTIRTVSYLLQNPFFFLTSAKRSCSDPRPYLLVHQ